MATENQLSVCDVFPALRSLGYSGSESVIKNFSLAGIVNSTPDAAYTIQCVAHKERRFDLRLFGLGDDAYFAWVADAGDHVGEPFTELTASAVEQFHSLIQDFNDA